MLICSAEKRPSIEPLVLTLTLNLILDFQKDHKNNNYDFIKIQYAFGEFESLVIPN